MIFRELRVGFLALVVFSCGGAAEHECQADYDCGPDDYCKYGPIYEDAPGCEATEEIGNTCERRPVAGDSCDDWDAPCAEGLVCHGAHEDTCQAASLPGGICADSSDCGADPKRPGSDEPVCDVSGPMGVCAAAGSLEAGAGCLETRACAEGLACRRTPDGLACVPPARPGEPCGERFDNEDELPLCDPGWCETERRLCRAPGVAGDECDSRRICEDGLICASLDEGYRCAAPFPEGARCTWPGECIAGLSCFDGLCAPPHGEGGSCRYEQDCADGFRCNWSERVCVSDG